MPGTRYEGGIDLDADLTGVTELRVHGVGGTTPEDLLKDPHLVNHAEEILSELTP